MSNLSEKSLQETIITAMRTLCPQIGPEVSDAEILMKAKEIVEITKTPEFQALIESKSANKH